MGRTATLIFTPGHFTRGLSIYSLKIILFPLFRWEQATCCCPSSGDGGYSPWRRALTAMGSAFCRRRRVPYQLSGLSLNLDAGSPPGVDLTVGNPLAQLKPGKQWHETATHGNASQRTTSAVASAADAEDTQQCRGTKLSPTNYRHYGFKGCASSDSDLTGPGPAPTSQWLCAC